MDGFAEDVRLRVYEMWSVTGAPPTLEDLCAWSGREPAEVEGALQVLHEHRDVVLRDGVLVMAHPFASVPLGFSVMGRRTLWWGGCAWDSFAIPHLVPDEPS